ncbi:MAG: exosortase-associated EpsI family protein [Verrucomicrobia bacterium]|nr:exosortase-associated EpsI family protein [Verrucomicrobiota bacterium]
MLNRKTSILIFSFSMLLIGGSAAALFRVQNNQTLGIPGVKVVTEPIYNPKGDVAGTNSIKLPANLLGFDSVPLPVTDVELNWLPPDTTYGRRHYKAKTGFEAMISVVLMGGDRTSIHKPEYCLTGQGWLIEKTETTTIRIPAPHAYDVPVKKMTVSRTIQQTNGQSIALKGIYVFWFVADDQLSAEHGDRMWRMAKDLLTRGVLERWAYVTYFTQCLPGQEDATYERMKEFIAASVPEFQITTGKPLAAETASAEARK